MEEVKSREEINDIYKWDLSVIFKDINSFNNFLEETKIKIEEFPKYKNKVMENANTLLEVINSYNEIIRRVEKLYSYANMLSDQDISNNKNQELLGKVINLYNLAIKNTYFVRVELIKESSNME